jgi:hypothetical protein
MVRYGLFLVAALFVLMLTGCSDNTAITSPASSPANGGGFSSLSKGALIANGWYEGDEIYYIAGGIEEGVTDRGENQIYLIGGDRMWQAQVVLHIPGEEGYSPHWIVNVVNTAPGKTLADILASSYVSSHYPEALFDDVADILGAESAGLVTVVRPGVVVLCPIVPEVTADAPGNTELPEDFPRPWPDTF